MVDTRQRCCRPRSAAAFRNADRGHALHLRRSDDVPDGIVGGAPYGAGTIAGADGSRAPTGTDLACARASRARMSPGSPRGWPGATCRGGRVMASLTVDFFHGAVCCWCFNISSRMRALAAEFDLDIRHRTFVLQASRAEMATRWGMPEDARETILGHWAACRESQRPAGARRYRRDARRPVRLSPRHDRGTGVQGRGAARRAGRPLGHVRPLAVRTSDRGAEHCESRGRASRRARAWL